MGTAGPQLPVARTVELSGRGSVLVRDSDPSGQRPAVVLLHGLAATGDLNWFPVLRKLGERYRLISFDHRGHGDGIRARWFRLRDCADDAAGVCRALGVTDAVLVGYSMGGPIAQLIWKRHRDLTTGLVLCATAQTFVAGTVGRIWARTSPVMAAGMSLTPGTVRRAVAGRMVERRMAGLDPGAAWVREQFAKNDPAAVAQAAASLSRFDSSRWIGRVDVPTSVVVTERDQLVPPSRQYRLAASIPGAEIFTVDADHGACVMARREFVAALEPAIASVLNRQSARR